MDPAHREFLLAQFTQLQTQLNSLDTKLDSVAINQAIVRTEVTAHSRRIEKLESPSAWDRIKVTAIPASSGAGLVGLLTHFLGGK